MKYRLLPVAVLLAISASAQPSAYLGPAVLSRGAGNIGTRSGQQVALRLFGGVSGFYDNGLLPFGTDGKGGSIDSGALEGVEANLGAYGVHQFQHASLGLDYRGNFRHYTNSIYDGSDNQLSLGYTLQKSRRLIFDMRQIAGIYSRSLNTLGLYEQPVGSIFDDTSLLYDNRAVFVQSTMDVSYLKSARTILTFGGDGYTVRRRANTLVGVNGYNLHGTISRRVSRETTVGLFYEHIHYDFPRAFGESDINAYQLQYGRSFGRLWNLTVNAGAYQTDVQGLQRVSLDPAVAALLGVGAGVQAFHRVNVLPGGGAHVERHFKQGTLGFSYSRNITPGNGVYLSSREESGSVNVGYTGIRKFSFGADGGYRSLRTLGQDLQGLHYGVGGGGFTYNFLHSLYATFRYDVRHTDVDSSSGFIRTSQRVSFGISFSPGEIPLSLW